MASLPDSRLAGSGRDRVRLRVRGRRRFQATGDGAPPSPGDSEGIWPPRREPSATERRLEWPFWLLLVVPWLLWSATLLLEHYDVCLICLPPGLSIP